MTESAQNMFAEFLPKAAKVDKSKNMFADLLPEISKVSKEKLFTDVPEVQKLKEENYDNLIGIPSEVDKFFGVDPNIAPLVKGTVGTAVGLGKQSIAGVTGLGQIIDTSLNTPSKDISEFGTNVEKGLFKAQETLDKTAKDQEIYNKFYLDTPKAKAVSKVYETAAKPIEWLAKGSASAAELATVLNKQYKEDKPFTLDDVKIAVDAAKDVFSGKSVGSSIAVPIAETAGAAVGLFILPKAVNKALNKVIKETKIIEVADEFNVSAETMKNELSRRGINPIIIEKVVEGIEARPVTGKISSFVKAEVDKPYVAKIKKSVNVKPDVTELGPRFGKTLELNVKDLKQVTDKSSNMFADVVEQAKDLTSKKSKIIPKEAKIVPIKAVEKSALLKDPAQQAFIDKKIAALGSLEAVKKEYKNDDSVSKYARQKAVEVYGGDPEIEILTPKIKSTPANTGYDVQGKGFDTQKGKVVPFAKEWVAKKEMKIAARKAGADVSEYDIREENGGWVFQRRKIKIPKVKQEKSNKIIKLFEDIKFDEDAYKDYIVRDSSTPGYKWDVVEKKSGAIVDQLTEKEIPKDYANADLTKIFLATDKEIKKTGLKVVKSDWKPVEEFGEVETPKTLGKPGFKKGKIVPWKIESFAAKAAEKMEGNWEVVGSKEKGWVIQERSKIDVKAEKKTPKKEEFLAKAKKTKEEIIKGREKIEKEAIKTLIDDLKLDVKPKELKPKSKKVIKNIEKVNKANADLKRANTPEKFDAAAKNLQPGTDVILIGGRRAVVVEVLGTRVNVRTPDMDKRGYIQVPISDVKIDSGVGELLGEINKEVRTKKGKLQTNSSKTLQQLGKSQYGSRLDEIVLKEMVQNAFDTLKEADYKGLTKNPRIDIVIDKDKRIIEFIDNGMGMSEKTVDDAFFTMGGSKKDVPPWLSSGGLGFAKIALFTSADRIILNTVKDGKRVTVDATTEDIINSNFEIKISNANKSEHGTSVKLWLPEHYINATGGKAPIPFPSIHNWDWKYGFMGKPLIGPVEVRVKQDGQTHVLEMGKNTNFKETPFLTKASFTLEGGETGKDFKWADVDVYFGVNRATNPKHYVLSSGVYQFSTRFGSQQEKIPYDIYVDFKPTVRADHEMYPFNNTREGFKEPISKEIEKLNAYLSLIARGEEAKGLASSFEDIVGLPKIDADVSKDFDVRREIDSVVESVFGKDSKLSKSDLAKTNKEIAAERSRIAPKKVDISNKGITTKAEGIIREIMGKDDLVKQVKSNSRFSAELPVAKVDEFIKALGKTPDKPIFHNNTSLDIRKFGSAKTVEFFADLGSILVDMRSDIGKIGGYKTLNDRFYSGISLDKTYSGLWIKVPYRVVYINPLQFVGRKPSTPAGLAAFWYKAAIHEYAHTVASGHDAYHDQQEFELATYLADQGLERYYQDAFFKIASKHETIWKELTNEYEKSTTKNITRGLKEYEGTRLSVPRSSGNIGNEGGVVQGRGESGAGKTVRNGAGKSGGTRGKGAGEGSSSVILTSGFDPIVAVKEIRALGKDIKSAIPKLEALGKHFYIGGKQKYFTWQKSMKNALGDLWERVKKYISKVWKSIKQSEYVKLFTNNRGSIEIPTMQKLFGKAPKGDSLFNKLKKAGVNKDDFIMSGLGGYLKKIGRNRIDWNEFKKIIDRGEFGIEKEVLSTNRDKFNVLETELGIAENKLDTFIAKLEKENGRFLSRKELRELSPEYIKLEEKRSKLKQEYNAVKYNKTHYGSDKNPELNLPGEIKDTYYENLYKYDPKVNSSLVKEYEDPHGFGENVMADARVHERNITIDGKDAVSLHADEIQSPWHDKGRAVGYNKNDPKVERYLELEKKDIKRTEKENEEFYDLLSELEFLADMGRDFSSIPDAPFKSSWHKVVLRDLISDAIAKGKSNFTWSTAKILAKRYNRFVDEVEWAKTSRGGYNVLFKKNGNTLKSLKNASLEEVKEMAGNRVGKFVSEADKGIKKGDILVNSQLYESLYDVKAVKFFKSEFGVNARLVNTQVTDKNRIEHIKNRIKENTKVLLNHDRGYQLINLDRRNQLQSENRAMQKNLERLYKESTEQIWHVPITDKMIKMYGGGKELTAFDHLLQPILNQNGSVNIPNLRKLGESVFTGKEQRYFDWQKKMKVVLGNLWEKVKKYIAQIWKDLKSTIGNERGSAPISDIRRSINRTKKLADEYLGSISTRLRNIDPSISKKLRRFEYNSSKKIEDITKIVLPFITGTNKMSKADYKTFDLARKNSNEKEINRLVEKYNLQEEHKQLRAILDVLRDAAIDVGHKTNYVKEYHPREINDIEGFLEYVYKADEWSTIDLFIKRKEKALGKYLTHEEKVKLINSLFRGYADERITLSQPGQLKIRKIKRITPELSKFYSDSNSALLRYVTDITTAVEARKLFGRRVGKGIDLSETIGSYILDLVEQNKLSPSQERELRSILKARFSPVGTKGVITTFKNLSYIDVMGSPISAVTQIGDVAWALYKNGIVSTAKTLPRAIIGKSKFTKEDLGISKIGAEFSDKTTSAKMVDFFFKATGLTKIDAIGKEVLINSAYNLAIKKAQTEKGRISLYNELNPIFGKETDALIKDFRNKAVTDNVNFYLFNLMSDFQPITLSEMPQKYLEGGNGRVFYMLKTFTLKKFDVFRREVFQQIAKPGSRLKGIKNLIRLAGYLMLAEATADVIQDLMLGRKPVLSDLIINNLWKLAGFSRYMGRRLKSDGLGTGIAQQLLPPFQLVNSITKDVVTLGDNKGFELVKSVPIVGKIYYHNWGKGARRKKSGNSILDSYKGIPQIQIPKIKIPKIKG